MPVLKEISNQFRLCVALMNDQKIMQHQPAIVADHFAAALCKIEQLRRFLKRPDKAHDHWVDESILDAGVRKMVGAVLNRHLEPLRTNTFPEVFMRDLGQDGEYDATVENLTEREIKETNCMGAIVLLYYYTFWHVMLILFNGKAYPCSKRSALWESELDFESFFNDMPTEEDMFELRYMTSFETAIKDDCFSAMPNFLMVDAFYSSMVADKTTLKCRETNVIQAYKRALIEARHGADATRWWGMNTSEAADKFGFEDLSRTITSDVLESRLALFGNVFSTYDQQDDIQKWRDMYADIEIQSGDTHPEDNDDDDDGKFRSNTKVYRQRLAKILKSKPYGATLPEFKKNAKSAAIFDYCSAALMMDVSRALVKMKKLIGILMLNDAQDIEPAFLQVVLSVHTKNSNKKTLEDLDAAESGLGVFKKFIRHTINQRKSITPHTITADAVMVDGLAGYYWGSRPCVGEGVNHMYLAWPDITKSDFKVLRAMQSLCLTQHGTAAVARKTFAFNHIQPAVRNSLFVSTSVTSLKKLIDAVKCHPAFPNSSHEVEFSTSPSKSNTNAFFLGDADIATKRSTVENHKELMNQSRALIILNQEVAELEKRTAEAPGFRKYPGISWPVTYVDGITPGTNYHCFEFVRPVPKMVPPLSDSVYGVRVAMDHFNGMAASGVRIAGVEGGGGGYVAFPNRGNPM